MANKKKSPAAQFEKMVTDRDEATKLYRRSGDAEDRLLTEIDAAGGLLDCGDGTALMPQSLFVKESGEPSNILWKHTPVKQRTVKRVSLPKSAPAPSPASAMACVDAVLASI